MLVRLKRFDPCKKCGCVAWGYRWRSGREQSNCLECKRGFSKARRKLKPEESLANSAKQRQKNPGYYSEYRKQYYAKYKSLIAEERRIARKNDKAGHARTILLYRYRKSYGQELAKPLVELFYMNKKLRLKLKESISA